jgi:ABC-2 type transport system permease protein
MNLLRTRAVARKEFLHILRDPRSLGLALALPLLMILLFGYALSLDVDRIATVIHDNDRTPESRELVEQFRGSRYFDIQGLHADQPGIEESLDRNVVLLAVVIPRGYGRDLLSGSPAQIQVLVDGSDSNTASIALGYTDALIQTHVERLRSRALNRMGGAQWRVPVEPRIRIWYNSELKSRNYIVPGLIAVILTIIAALLTSLTIAREWETGTMEQVLSTPVRPAELVLGKMLAFFALDVADTLLTLAAGVFVFRVPLRGNLIFLALTCCIFLVGALCWGILLSAIARSQLLAYQMGMISSFLPAFILSGFIYATENMPVVIQVFSHVIPARYFVTMLKGIFLKGVGLTVLWVELAFLLAYAAFVFTAATRVLKRKLVQ